MKETTFKSKNPNHFYAQRNEKGQLELIQEPEQGKKYFEFACVSGGMV